ncbi:thiol reductant ABC exporter subunit CydC [Myceligenerans pegani]|uniref:Thiol reductant ABC exporter subunit CydC n=1 Tax=Myceligenerans pegani TaxID=2776917 RepID=A0ABR9MUH9_9MICO|nr:thiol reductant ABC exporter subunit CydC [Myceligenerans sp. TRM 65318]MBE1874599.1 thiol reductant ABC exporter subunit CydC [Myceligenerans sp. TRM 65318]MBE3016870.1 thiol reductant ABC exporter subunit CydC [Myceligenerans sp. TRM 65318]
MSATPRPQPPTEFPPGDPLLAAFPRATPLGATSSGAGSPGSASSSGVSRGGPSSDASSSDTAANRRIWRAARRGPRRDPLWRLLPLLEVRPGRVAAAVGLGTLALVCAIGLAAVAAWLIARASQMPPVLTLSVAVVAVRAFGIGRGVLRYLERLASHDVALRGMSALRTRVYAGLADAPGTPSVRRGDLLARLGADVDSVGDVVVRAVIPAGVALVTGAGSVVLVGVFLPEAGIALAVCLLLAGVVVPWLAARAAARVEADGAAARGRVSGLALELLEEAPQLRVAGRFAARSAELRAADRELDAVHETGARVSGVSAGLGSLAQGLAVVAALLLGIPAVAAGRLAPEELSVVVLTPLAVFEATAGLPAAAVQWHRSREAARRLLGLLGDGSDGSAERVGESRPDLHGVALDLEPGTVTVVTGPSGSGKTTLLMRSAGLLPDRGVLPAVAGGARADAVAASAGTGTAQAHAGAARDDVGRAPALGTLFVAEDGHVFGTTVLENLRVARGDVDEGEARAALGAVGLTPWLDGLPDGLDTLLGTDATNVSGGERRRLLIARALLARADALLVDEPAEHLDAAAADDVMRVLAHHARTTGTAVALATHRPAPRGLADREIALTPRA